jgi:ATP-binding cassette, subfamily C, bacterial CydD
MKLLDKKLILALKGQYGIFILVVFFGLIAGYCLIVQSRLISQIIAEGFLAFTGIEPLVPLLFYLLVIIVLRSIFVYFSDVFAKLLSVNIRQEFRNRFFNKVLQDSPVQQNRTQSGEKITMFIEGIEDLDKYFSEYIPQIIYSFSLPVMILFFIFPLDLLSGVILLITAPLIPIFMILIGSQAEKITRQQWETFSRLGAHYMDALRGLVTLKSLSQAISYQKFLTERNNDYLQTTMKVLRITFLSAFVLELVATISTAIIAVEIGLRLIYGNLEFQTAFFILLLVPEYYSPLRQLSLKFHASNKGVAASEKLFAYFKMDDSDAGQDINILEAENDISGKKIVLSNDFAITFADVSYQYPDRSDFEINRVSFSINSGMRIAIVGESGSGKSTLLYLLLKFLKPSSGEIRVNNVSIHALSSKKWLESIAWVPQYPHVLGGTVAQNVSMSFEFREEKIWEALHLAELDDWVRSLREGVNSEVGENGVLVSTGQAQRLVLARAFYKNSPLLIMDEPTSSVDPRTEVKLQASLNRLALGRTVVTIAHRLPTIVTSDVILVMKQGKLIEMGDHSALLANRSEYFNLVRAYSGSI